MHIVQTLRMRCRFPEVKPRKNVPGRCETLRIMEPMWWEYVRLLSIRTPRSVASAMSKSGARDVILVRDSAISLMTSLERDNDAFNYVDPYSFISFIMKIVHEVQ